MKNRGNAWLLLFVVAVLAIALQGCATYYSADAITGKLVDEDNGVPVEGVIVVASWTIDRHWVGDDNVVLKVMETVSDKDGNYAFPSWSAGPLHPLADFRQGRDPLVGYFKSGYWPRIEKNPLRYDDRLGEGKVRLGEFVANGKTIKLKKWDGKDVLGFWKALDLLASAMPAFYKRGDWKNYPRMAWAIRNENLSLREMAKLPWNAGVSGFHYEYLSDEDKKYLERAIK